MNHDIQRTKTSWSPSFAINVYNHVAERGLYITNIVKWAGLDAKLPEKDKIKLYAPVSVKELKLLNAKRIIAFGQLTFDCLLRELSIKSLEPFGICNENMLATQTLKSTVTELGEITPCYFPVGQGVKNRLKAVEILKLTQRS